METLTKATMLFRCLQVIDLYMILYLTNLEICLPHSETSASQLIDKVYSGIKTLQQLSDVDWQQYFSERAVLAALNADVDELNNKCLHRLEGESRTYVGIDTAVEKAGEPDHSIPKEFLATLNLSGMPAHSITLKEGCPIILLHNLNPPKGLCNGTRLIVTKLRERVIEAMILSGTRAGQTAFIPQLTLLTSQGSTGLSFCLKRRQFLI